MMRRFPLLSLLLITALLSSTAGPRDRFLPLSWMPTAQAATAGPASAPEPSKAKTPNKQEEDTAAKDTTPRLGWDSVAADLDTQLDQDQKTLDTLFTSLRKIQSPSGLVLGRYSEQISTIRKHMASILSQVQPYDAAMTSIIQILGDAPVPGEAASITTQRTNAQKTSRNIKTMIVRAKLYDLQARQLTTLIDTLRSHIEQVTLSQRSLSPLTPTFWHAFAREYAADSAAIKAVGTPDVFARLAGGLVLSLLASGAVSLLIGRFWSVIMKALAARNGLPETQSDPVFFPIITFFAGVAGSAGAILCWTLWQGLLLPQGTNSLIDMISQNLPFYGFILGIGLPWSQWHKGRPLWGSSLLLVIGLLLYSLLKTFQNQEIVGPRLNALLETCFALICALGIFFRAYHVRHAARIDPTAPGTRFKAPFYAASLLLLAISLVAVASGYVSFTFVLHGEIINIIYAFSVTGVLIGAWQAFSTIIFSPQYIGGRGLARLGLEQRRLEQMNVLSSAAGCLLLILVFIALLGAHGDLSLKNLWTRLGHIFTGTSGHGLPLSPETIILCIAIIIGAQYLISFIRGWLTNKLFPTTSLDAGAQNSILSILTYSAWILVGLAILSLIGLSVQNLTWVVSALSVGVGFGLQSIVKDFISGLILLAERPVQTGDIIEIAGNRGEVRRVNVRATDITLNDGSTLIVPNSQFITSNVKNASFGGMPTRLALNFSLPVDADFEKTRTLLLAVIATQNAILKKPAPQIRFTALNGATITLSLTVSVPKAREEEDVRDTLLVEIFRRFHQEGIAITMS